RALRSYTKRRFSLSVLRRRVEGERRRDVRAPRVFAPQGVVLLNQLHLDHGDEGVAVAAIADEAVELAKLVDQILTPGLTAGAAARDSRLPHQRDPGGAARRNRPER